jgi:hypothetical protein
VCAPGEPPVNTTVPFAGSDADSIVNSSPSASRSLANTSTGVAAESSGTDRLSSTATAGSGTQLTMTETVAVEPPLSVYVNVSSAAPREVLQ